MIASSGELDVGSLHRLEFWQDQLGTMPLADITADHVDDALDALVRRGKLRTGRRVSTESSTRFFRKGSIDYRKAAADAGMDLESYRKPGTDDVRVTVSPQC